MLAKISVAAMSVAVLMIAGCAQDGDLGQEWSTISEDDFKVTLDAPGLAGGTTRFYRTLTAMHHTVYTGQWVGPGRKHAEALIVLQELSPEYYFPTEVDLREKLRELKNESTLTFDSDRRSEKKFGTIRYETFTSDSAPCVGFYRYSGIVNTDAGTVPLGDTVVFGYYCAAAAGSLASGTISSVLTSLHIKN
jgi:hypothetical protein